MKWAGWIVLFVAALAISLAVRAPAALLTGAVAEALAPEGSVGPLEGTVWNGHTSSVTYQGVALGTLDWRVEGVGLFPPGATVWLTLDGPNLRVTGRVAAATGGSDVRLSDVDMRFLPGQLAAAFGQDDVKPTGSAHIAIADAVIDADGGLASVAGKAEWKDAGVSAPTEISLGNLVLDVAPKPNGGVSGTLVSSDGDIDLDGTVSVDRDGTYRLNVAIVAGPTVPSEVNDVIRVIAPPDGAGVRRLVASGTLGGSFLITPPAPGGPGLSLRGTNGG